MSNEQETIFFKKLTLITTLLIKQGAPAYRDLMPLVQEYEAGQWEGLSIAEKCERLDKVKKATAPETNVALHFAKFPYEWTQSQFDDFVIQFNTYHASICPQMESPA